MERKKFPPLLPSLGRLLGFANGTTSALSQSLLDEHDLLLMHWVILTALWRRDGLLVSEISKYYRVNAPAASRLVDRMVAKGLIERRGDPGDRRAVRVYLTQKSRDLSHLLDFYKDINALVLSDFSDEEAAQLFDMLERVANNAKAATASLGKNGGSASGAGTKPASPPIVP